MAKEQRILKTKGKTAVLIDYANIKAWAREKELAFDMDVLYKMLKSSGVEKTLFYYGTDLSNKVKGLLIKKARPAKRVLKKSRRILTHKKRVVK